MFRETDIFSTFEEPWYSASGRPLELYFFDNFSSLSNEQCGSYLGDGICNSHFNDAEYDYDEGDCCAATCDETQCGIGTLTYVFGTNITSGNGYPNCLDKTMQSITIRINNVFLRPGDLDYPDTSVRENTDTREREPLMILDCDGKNVLMASINRNMKNKTEVVKVADGANCIMMVRNSTAGKNPSKERILHVNYTVFHGDEKSIAKNPIVMVHGNSFREEMSYFQRIDECYFTKLKGLINMTTIYTDSKPSNKAVKWLMKDSGIFSNCERQDFLERYALATINFAAPIVPVPNGDNGTVSYDKGLWITQARHCVWRAVGCTGEIVTELNYRFLGKNLMATGTLASEIGLLKNLTKVFMSKWLVNLK